MIDKDPNLSIIILNYNSFDDTISYVRSLLEQIRVKLNIVVVDNASPNDSYRELQKEFKKNEVVHVLQSGYNGGYSFGNNFGLKYVKKNKLSDLVIISNNDIELNGEYFLYNFVKQFYKLPNDKAFVSPIMYTNGKVSSVAARRLPTLKDDIINSSILLSKIFGKKNRYHSFPSKSFFPIDCMPGSFFMGRMCLFERINYLDEKLFLFGEERIIGLKVKKEELQNYLLPDMYFTHYASKTINNEVEFNYKQKLRNQGKLYYWKNYRKLSKVSILFFKSYLKLCEIEHLIFRKN